MEKIEKQLLRDAEIQPTDDVLATALGEGYKAYTKFVDMLEGFDVKLAWRYYSDGKAWLAKGIFQWKSSRGTDKQKTIFWLSVWDGFFKLSFFIAEKARAGLQGILLCESIKKMIENAKPMGKLRFLPLIFDVRSEQSLDGFGALIDYQKSRK